MRLRIFDLNTPWFWLVIFFQRAYSKPWIEALLYQPAGWTKFWFNFWQWEKQPDDALRGVFSVHDCPEGLVDCRIVGPHEHKIEGPAQSQV